MKRLLAVILAGVPAISLALSGCQDSDFYSAAVKYGLRTDPLVKAAQPGDLGEDAYEPDRPGLLPLRHPHDVYLPEHPMYTKNAKESLFKKDLLRDPMILPAADRQQLEQILANLFGTPSEPKVGEISADDRDKLKLDEKSLREGSRLYRINCVHCHGVPGDGRGPTARWVSPHPRDFRQGLFKFMSVDQTDPASLNRPPRREDLVRTLRNGIEGTGMPSFLLLKPEDLEHLVSYVIHLSLRGKTEFDTIAVSYDFDPDKGTLSLGSDTGLADEVKGWLTRNTRRWIDSQSPQALIQIPKYDEKFKKDPKKDTSEWEIWKDQTDAQKWKIRGAIAQALFNNEEARLPEAKRILDLRGDKPANVNCKQCHSDYGRQAKFKVDAWGTLVRPNNFLLGVFRGGRRPADIYHRIHSGISGSNMTPFGNPATMSSNSIWDMAEFVQALSYPAMRSKLGVVID